MFDLHPFLLITFFATIISLSIVLYCIAYLRRYGATTQIIALTASAFGASIWALFGMLTLTATTYETTMLAYKFRHVGAFGILIPFLLYAFTFGPAKKWVTKTTTGILTVSMLPLFVLLITAPNQYLFISPSLEFIHGHRPP
jgi:hypothetical protein